MHLPLIQTEVFQNSDMDPGNKSGGYLDWSRSRIIPKCIKCRCKFFKVLISVKTFLLDFKSYTQLIFSVSTICGPLKKQK